MVYRASAGGGSGSGSGTVNSGTAPQVAFYATTGTAVSGATGVNTNTVSPGISIVGGTITAVSNALLITQTWNNAAIVFPAVQITATKTASAAGSSFISGTVSGTTKSAIVNETGILAYDTSTDNYASNFGVGTLYSPGSGASFDTGMLINARVMSFYSNTGKRVAFADGVTGMQSGNVLGWWSGGTGYPADALDTGLARRAASVVEINNGTAGTIAGCYLRYGGQARVAADVSIVSSATLADVSGLSVNVTSGRTYQFQCVLYTTANVAGGIKAAVNATAAATFVRYEGYTLNSNTVLGQTRATSVGTAVGSTITATAAMVLICGTITPSAAGTFTVQAAQAATIASATVILAGSSMTVQDVT